MQEVEERDNHPFGEPADHPASQRNDLLVLLTIRFQCTVVVRTEIELIVQHHIVRDLEISAHICTAMHQVMRKVFFRDKVDGQFS